MAPTGLSTPFDRPEASADGVAAGDLESRFVAMPVGPNRRLCNHGTRGRDDDRERVLIAVRVHTDHVIHLVCKASD